MGQYLSKTTSSQRDAAAEDEATAVDAAAANMDTGWKEFKESYVSGGVEALQRLVDRKLNEWKNIPMNVAVIGGSGVGKSSFINAIRRLTADDEGAAEVGVDQATTEMQSYPHPNNPLLKFWDLPDVGTDRFPWRTYLEDIDVGRCDFFLLFTATRFTENDTWLGKEIAKRNKKYFFIRTKIGVDIWNSKKSHPRIHDEQAVVNDIRELTERQLKEHGSENVPVFLIDNYKPNKYDFEELELRLIEDFPDLKKSALILSLQAISKEMIRLKVEELRSRFWIRAAVSGVVAAIPVPGLSLACDLAIVVQGGWFYYHQLGLDEKSLRRYATVMSTDYQELQSIVLGSLGLRLVGSITVEVFKTVIPVILRSAVVPLASAAAVGGVFRFIPFIGSFIAAPISYVATHYALKVVLDKMESVTMNVMDSHISAKIADDTQ